MGLSRKVKAEIYDPNAQFLTTLQVNNSGTTWQDTLLETGIYTVVVTELGNNGSVNYHLNLQHLFGTCPAPRPEITVITSPDPLRLIFPETLVGEQSAAQTVTVRNDGGATLDVGIVLLAGDDADQFTIDTDGCTGQALAPTASCTLDVSFGPLSLGAKSAYLEVPSNDADEDLVYVVLATGHDEPEIAVAPAFVDFGTVPVSGSETQAVWIDNYGAAPLQLGALSLIGPNASQFSLSADGCSDRRLFAFQSCTLTVEFDPTSIGSKTATLVIPSDDPDEGLIELSLIGDVSGFLLPTHVGFWRPSSKRFYLDANGSGRWNGTSGGDIVTAPWNWVTASEIPVVGDWDGDGDDEVGFWRPSTKRFYLDANGSGSWNGPSGGDIVTSPWNWVTASEIPVIGDWDGDGDDDVGFWRPSTKRFYLDANGNGRWNGPSGGDVVTAASNWVTASEIPITGDWDGDGDGDVGFWRPSAKRFYLDANGNGSWNGPSGGDVVTAPWNWVTVSDVPSTGDWAGEGYDDVGFWRPSTKRFYLDANGNGSWNGSSGGDVLTAPWNWVTTSEIPVTGRW